MVMDSFLIGIAIATVIIIVGEFIAYLMSR
jgi:hypothetical protein